ncbi:MAG: glycosyltransferase [Polyangiaceae bacterium]|nr:glycosyltransferase [Polyangiaceae bacterium]
MSRLDAGGGGAPPTLAEGAPPELSAVLPCHEEAENLEGVVTALCAAAGACGIRSMEVLLVCARAARDGTPALARALSARDARVRVIDQGRTPPGYGGAVRLGLGAARAPWVLLLDADGQLDPGELGRLWPLRAPLRAVIGVRSPRRDAAARRVAGHAYRSVARWALPGLPAVQDPDCAFKLLPRAAIDPERLRLTSGGLNLELLAAMHDRGATWVEVPVTHRPRRAGIARFEVTAGPLSGLPRPGAALELLRDVVALASRRLVRSWPRA